MIKAIASTLLAATVTATPALAQAAAWHGDIDHDLATTSALTQLAAGSIPENLDALESQLRSQGGTASYLRAITALGFRMRGTGPALTATSSDMGIQLLVYVAAHDTEGVRTTVYAIDEARSHLARRNLPPPVDLAEAELSLGDTSAALARLRDFRSRAQDMERTVSWGAVQNGWLLGRTWALLAQLARAKGATAEADSAQALAIAEGDSMIMTPAATGAVSLTPANGASRVRYDAVLWMQPVVSLSTEPQQPTARLTFVASEQRTATARGASTTQTFDSIAMDVPMLDRLGADGLAIRRAIQGSAGSLTTVTETDSLERTTARTMSASALPEEMKKLIAAEVGFGPLGSAAVLPGGSARVGQSWTSALFLSVPGAADPTPVTATYRLERIAESGSRRLAFISIAATTTTPARMSDGGQVQVRLSGELVRDVTTGETLRLAASLRGTVWTATGSQMPVRVLLTALRESGSAAQTIAMR